MTAFNVVRFRVKPGHDQEFMDAHKNLAAEWPGLRHANIIKTGEQCYCIIGEWSDMDAFAAARPYMIRTLSSFRHTLEDLGGGLGITDPVSGPVVMENKAGPDLSPSRLSSRTLSGSKKECYGLLALPGSGHRTTSPRGISRIWGFFSS